MLSFAARVLVLFNVLINFAVAAELSDAEIKSQIIKLRPAHTLELDCLMEKACGDAYIKFKQVLPYLPTSQEFRVALDQQNRGWEFGFITTDIHKSPKEIANYLLEQNKIEAGRTRKLSNNFDSEVLRLQNKFEQFAGPLYSVVCDLSQLSEQQCLQGLHQSIELASAIKQINPNIRGLYISSSNKVPTQYQAVKGEPHLDIWGAMWVDINNINLDDLGRAMTTASKVKTEFELFFLEQKFERATDGWYWTYCDRANVTKLECSQVMEALIELAPTIMQERPSGRGFYISNASTIPEKFRSKTDPELDVWGYRWVSP